MNTLTSILQQCQKSNRVYQKKLYENYYPYTLKVAYRYNDSYDVATTTVNDSFVSIFKSIHQFKIDCNNIELEKRFLGWIRKIVINKSLDYIRSQTNKIIFNSIDENNFEIEDNSTNADTLLLYKEMMIFLKHLPQHHQLVFNLYVIDGYTHNEIASMLNITEGTSKSHLFRAKQTLQLQLTSFFEINR